MKMTVVDLVLDFNEEPLTKERMDFLSSFFELFMGRKIDAYCGNWHVNGNLEDIDIQDDCGYLILGKVIEGGAICETTFIDLWKMDRLVIA